MVKISPREITAYQISELFAAAYGKSATVQNATSGFATTGICSFNPNTKTQKLVIFENLSPFPKATSHSIKKHSLLTSSPDLILLKEEAEQKRNKTDNTKRKINKFIQ